MLCSHKNRKDPSTVTSSHVHLVSNLSWTVFWLTILVFIIVREGMFRTGPRARRTEGGMSLPAIARSTAPGVGLALLLALVFQVIIPLVVPSPGIAAPSVETEGNVSATSLLSQGETIFRTKGCLGCHAIKGVSEIGTIGPELTHIASQETIADEIPYSKENLREWLVNPHEIKPGTQMPNMNLQPADLDAIVTYLDSLK